MVRLRIGGVGFPGATAPDRAGMARPLGSQAVSDLTRVAVFCGSSDAVDKRYLELAFGVGRALAEAEIAVVYGGGATGLMGAAASGAMSAGGTVFGVIPAGLFANGIDHADVTTLEEVADMHERKARMYDLADGFIGLPGGMGTFEEVFEAATWTQLGLHGGDRAKPVTLLDRGDYWRPVGELLDRAFADGFMAEDTRAIVDLTSTIDEAIASLRARS